MKNYGLFLFLIIVLISSFGVIRAQTTDDVEAKRAQLQAELEAEERAIAEQTKLLQAKQKETATVTGEIQLLKSQIARAQANIKAKKVAISRLEDDIIARQGRISVLDQKVKSQQTSLSELLRQTRDTDSASFVEIILDSSELSDFFHDIDNFNSVQKAIHLAVAELRDTRELTEKEKAGLEKKKNSELDAKKTIEYEQALIAQKEKERQQVLTVTKTQEKAYEQVLAARRQKAAQIRAALFALRDTAAIPFGRALEFATAASKQTGVRPAFLLAILKQESNLGENVGQCFVTNFTTGGGVGKNTGTAFAAVMKPSRDVPPFLRLAAELGFEPSAQVVSCPQAGGYGGAMGPAQFIPSTWELFKSRIASLLGKKVANPWEPEDAFMASSLYLADLGAGLQTYSAEVAAACRYYGSGGGSCVYGNQVMAKAQDIQLNMIDPLQNI